MRATVKNESDLIHIPAVVNDGLARKTPLTTTPHGSGCSRSLRLRLQSLAHNTNPRALFPPQHRRTDRKLMHGDVRRQRFIQDGRHKVGRERGQVFLALRRRPEVNERPELAIEKSTGSTWSVQAVDSWLW